jgi:hypothetical protein
VRVLASILSASLTTTLALVAGCGASRADLEAAAGATSVAGGEGVVAQLDGVRVSAVARSWPGPVDIAREVTPVKLTITNDGVVPLAVRYENLALVGPDGRRYNALPPLRVSGQVTREVAASPVLEPAFVSDGFVVAPYYTAYYPGFGVAADPFYHDPLYYDTYYDYWVDIRLPTGRMLQWALPDGRLAPDGVVTGWVYFEHVDPDLPRVRLRVDVVDARDGSKLGELALPFAVDDEA